MCPAVQLLYANRFFKKLKPLERRKKNLRQTHVNCVAKHLQPHNPAPPSLFNLITTPQQKLTTAVKQVSPLEQILLTPSTYSTQLSSA
jgi:hypothetical protein